MSEAQSLETGNVDETGALDPGSDDAAVLAFQKKHETEAEEVEQTSEDEAATESDEEADEAEPADEEEADELVEMELDGKTYKVPKKLQEGNLRQSDYSRKMAEVQTKEKAIESRAETIAHLEEAAEKRAESLATVRELEAQIKKFDGIDWAKAKKEAPADAAIAAVDLLNLQSQLRDAKQAAANVATELTKGQNKLLEEKRVEMFKVLEKDLKGWSEQKGEEITKYALSQGYDYKAIAQATDPRWVIALDKAMRFDKLQAEKSNLKAKAKDAPPVNKPGAPRKVDVKTDAMTRLRKSNSEVDAIAAFLSR